MTQNQIIKLLSKFYICHLKINQNINQYVIATNNVSHTYVDHYKKLIALDLKNFDAQFVHYSGMQIHTQIKGIHDDLDSKSPIRSLYGSDITLNTYSTTMDTYPNENAIANLEYIELEIKQMKQIRDTTLSKIICSEHLKNSIHALFKNYNSYFKIVSKFEVARKTIAS